MWSRFLFELLLLGFSISPFNCKVLKDIFDPQPINQDAIDGRNAMLRCGINQTIHEDYTISWVADGKPIKNNERRFQEGNNLHFQPINRFIDGNEFQCVARFQNGDVEYSDSAQFNIKWLQVGGVELKRPSKPSDILSDMKGTIALNCNITGNPVPNNFVWFINGTQLQNQQRGSLRMNSKGRLSITQPRLYENDGVYNCCADYLQETKCTPKGGEFRLQVKDHRVPRLIKPPTDVVVKRGSSVTLDCVYKAVPPPQIVWRRKGGSKPLTNSSNSGQCNRRCVFSNGTLVLKKVKETAATEYECFAKQRNSETSPVSASVILAYIKPFSDGSTEKFVLADVKFEFNCEIPSGLPEPTLLWKRLRDNKTIREVPGHVTRVQDNLVIDNVTPGDAGTYMCVASNIAGSVTKNVSLSIGSKPHFETLTSEKVKEGSNFTWACPVSGNPEPTVLWYKDNSLITSVSGRAKMMRKQLLLTNVKMTDEGSYHCSGRNELDNNAVLSSYARLDVIERLKFWPPLRNTTIALGEPSKVNCTVSGSEAAKVTWQRLNAPMDSNITMPGTSNLRTLFFHHPVPGQSGWYRCNASDEAAGISGMIYIKVVRRPRIDAPPTDHIVYAGKPFMLHCSSNEKAKDKARVTWTFGNQAFSQSDFELNYNHPFVTSNGSLIIPIVRGSDTGLYTCTYERDGLTDVASAELTVVEEGIPGSDTPATEDKSNTQMIQTIALSVSGGIAYVLATAALIIYCRRKHRKQRSEERNQDETEIMLNGTSNGRTNHDDEVISTTNGIPLDELAELKPDIKHLEYPAANIQSVTIIGKGEFGDVFLSKAPGLFPDLDEDILVMVKQFNPPSDQQRSRSSLRAEFNREINLLHMASHDGVVKLLALSSDAEDGKPNYLITEYLEWGILKLCLNGSKTKQIPKFTKNNKMNMCCQLACGLDHLAKLGLHHNDVATRNCVISFQLLVKISILGLTREGFENEYSLYKGKRLPVRWMAPEAIFDGETSPKTVVWSFGVSCWEIFTLADLPYENMKDEEFLRALQSNDPPVLSPLEGSKRINSLIKKCCQSSPKDRPEMKQITKKLQSILASGDAPDDKSIETSALLT